MLMMMMMLWMMMMMMMMMILLTSIEAFFSLIIISLLLLGLSDITSDDMRRLSTVAGDLRVDVDYIRSDFRKWVMITACDSLDCLMHACAVYVYIAYIRVVCAYMQHACIKYLYNIHYELLVYSVFMYQLFEYVFALYRLLCICVLFDKWFYYSGDDGDNGGYDVWRWLNIHSSFFYNYENIIQSSSDDNYQFMMIILIYPFSIHIPIHPSL